MPRKCLTNAYAKKYMHQTQVSESIKATTMSAVVAISSEHGLVTHHIADGAFNSDLFLVFLAQIKLMVGDRKDVVIFMDNLRVHHSKPVAERLQKYGWTTVFNAAYSSELHCIENVFGSVKRNYRKFMKEETGKIPDWKHQRYIRSSIEDITNEQIKKTIARFERIWRLIIQNKDDWRKRPDELDLGRWFDLMKKTE
jgi:transposase